MPKTPRACARRTVDIVCEFGARSHDDPDLLVQLSVSANARQSPDRKKIDAVVPTLQAQIDLLDKALGKAENLGTNTFTFADMNVLPTLWYVRRYPEGAAAFASAANLARYYDRHAKRPCFMNTIPPTN